MIERNLFAVLLIAVLFSFSYVTSMNVSGRFDRFTNKPKAVFGENGKKISMKKKLYSFLLVSLMVTIIPFSSAGFFSDAYGKITGKAAQSVTVNVTVGVPEIRNVYNNTASIIAVGSGLASGPANTSLIVNFSVYLGTGVANMNNASATINFSKAGEALRENSTCNQFEVATNVANYTCNVTMSWYDGAGAWAIQAFISDLDSNDVKNNSANFSVGETTGFEMGSLSWASLAPGQINQTVSAALRLNNTGNKNMSANTTQINVTNLRGETTTTQWIFANNISVSWDATAFKACDTSGGNGIAANNMINTTFVNISRANLTKGNYLLNDGSTGQEDFYFCIKAVGAELTSQSYSTVAYGPWMVQILLAPLILFNKRKRVGVVFRKRNLLKTKYFKDKSK